MQKLKLHIIVGSVREKRSSLPIAQWAYEKLKGKPEFSVEVVDLKTWALPFFALAKPPAMGGYEDPLQKKWAEKVAEADAYLFVTPEYNHGYSAVLKNALDYVFAEWGRKPASYVTFGSVGGARSVEQLRQVLVELQVVPLRSAVHITNHFDKVKADRFTPEEKESNALEGVAKDLAWWGEALRAARAEKK